MIRISALLLAIVLFSAGATAQTVCSQRGTFLEHLSNRYSEVPIAMGLPRPKAACLRSWLRTPSWTLIVTRPSGELYPKVGDAMN